MVLRNQLDEQAAGRNCEIEEVLEKLELGASQMCEIWGGVLSCNSIIL
jgi:hypothetical protein